MQWYPIETLIVEARPVLYRLGSGEALGFLKFTRSGRKVYRVGTLKKSVDLPKRAIPFLWRPQRPDLWPDPLPEPATVRDVVHWHSPPVERWPSEPPLSADSWPYPGIRLGRAGEPPRTEKEAEARALRAIRTRETLFADQRPAGMAAWPKDLMIAAAVVRKMLENSRSGFLVSLAPADYADFHIDKSDLRPLPARWMPTPRDVSDVGFAAYLSDFSDRDYELFVWRAALPPYSWTQIAELRRVREATVEAAYRAAVADVFARAAGEH